VERVCDMACYKPLHGFKAENGGFTGDKARSPTGIPMSVPCGQCIGCRLDRSRQWATRMVHELKYHTEACFITLTYAPEHLPNFGNLHVQDFQKFMKDLRYHFSYVAENPETGKPKRYYRPIRYFHCGEYGEKCLNCGENKLNCKCGHYSATLGRPHFHAIIYGVEFYDLELLKKTKSGEFIYKSQTLTDIWGKGHASVGNVTFESCAYVARYVTKKITGEQADGHYMEPITIDEETGEVLDGLWRNPEYTTMSRRPGIGHRITDQRAFQDIFPHDRVVLRRQGYSSVSKPPRYYDKLLEKTDPEMYEQIKSIRKREANKNAEDNTDERLLVKEQVKLAQIKTLKRDLNL
jgi:hypothetical protein